MEKSAIVKIDLCGSKDYVDTQINYDGDIREKLLKELHEFVKGVFPYSDKAYPDGSTYSAQGDCIYIILNRPTVAVRSTIEFMKGWYGKLPSLPDCRAVLDYGEILQTNQIQRLELLGEPFENISKMEKHFSAGQIGVTDKIIEKSDSTIVQYIRPLQIEVSSKRTIDTYIVNYEDPRLINYSSLAHALFIVDPSSSAIRNRAFEALLVEALIESQDSLTISVFNDWLHQRNLPEPSPIQFDKIIENSKFIKRDAKNQICWKKDSEKAIQELQGQFDHARQTATNFITTEIARKIGISDDELQSKLDIGCMTEEYLCAVFLQIRMMANYFRSTGILFERLSSYKDFDYILAKHFKQIIKNRQEEFLLFKRAFLEALKDLAQKRDIYIASIFHNVLLLYYLNKNSTLSRGQLAKIKGKEIYLDANTFYAYVCKSSTFYSILTFTVDRLKKLGSKLYVFDKSFIEYINSLDFTLRKYKNSHHYEFVDGGPWIWKEFISDISRYRNDFELCVALHRFTKISPEHTDALCEEAKEELAKIEINLVTLEPFLNKEQLGDLYDVVYNSKLKYDPCTQWYVPKSSPEQYETIVLHDANCLKHLEQQVLNPLDAKKLFVTCDFRLAKVRKKNSNKYEFMITVPEFYEFMLPYLFMDNEMVKQPVEMPNFLLASLVHQELFETIDFKDLFGNYLANNIDRIEDFKILEDLSTTKRYKDIQKKFEKLAETKPDEIEPKLKSFLQESSGLLVEYSNNVKESLAKSFVQQKVDLQAKEICDLKKKMEEMEARLNIFEVKEKKRKKYYKKHQQKKKQK